MPAHVTTLSKHELRKDLTPMATLKGAKMSIPFTEASATKPEAMVANPIPQVAMRKVSASRCDGYLWLWCSVTIQDSNAVARRVAPAPDHKAPTNIQKNRRIRDSREVLYRSIDRHHKYDERDSHATRERCIRERREGRDHLAQRGEPTTAVALLVFLGERLSLTPKLVRVVLFVSQQ